jgi:hypothetical protein
MVRLCTRWQGGMPEPYGKVAQVPNLRFLRYRLIMGIPAAAEPYLNCSTEAWGRHALTIASDLY